MHYVYDHSKFGLTYLLRLAWRIQVPRFFHGFLAATLSCFTPSQSSFFMATTAFPPPYFITADDKRGLIVVTAALVLAFVWTCSLIRTWLRWQTRDCKIDDWFLVLATVSVTTYRTYA
jgi:hypothetical protein